MLERHYRFSNSLKKYCQIKSAIVKPNKVVKKYIAETDTVFDFGKTFFLIADDVIGHTQLRIVLNVWRSKVSLGACIYVQSNTPHFTSHICCKTFEESSIQTLIHCKLVRVFITYLYTVRSLTNYLWWTT